MLSAEALLLMVQAGAGAHHREEALLEARYLAHERTRVVAAMTCTDLGFGQTVAAQRPAVT